MKKLHILILSLIILVGFFFRLKGISTNHSFWSDEAYMASFAYDITQNGGDIYKNIKVQDYQPLQLVVVTIGMALFGPSEWSARIFSVVIGTVGILFAYLVAEKLSNKSGGLLAAFLYAFSQVNLANATQAKQYTILQTIILVIIYLLFRLQEIKKKQWAIHLTIMILATLSTLLHFIGILAWIPYVIFILMEYRRKITTLLKKPRNILLLLVAIVAFGLLANVPLMIKIFTGDSFKQTFFPYNHITFFRELFWRNYGFILLPALFGFVLSYKKHTTITIAIIGYVLALCYLWIFKHYTHNIRYIVPFFGILFVYFAVFWSSIGKELFNGKAWVTCVIVGFILYAGGYKFVRKPATYYSPNADLASDVQNADYQAAFRFIDNTFPDRDGYVLVNATVDVHLYYDHGRAPEALFRKPYTSGLEYGETAVLPLTQTPIFTTLEQFEGYLKKNPKGIIVVEDWESILSDEVKTYSKNNLKREYYVEHMSVSPTDKWPIELYSWGMGE